MDGYAMAGVFSFMSLYVLIAWFACGALASHVASEKDRCGICWFVWGVAFGPMALLATVGLPDNRFTETQIRYIRSESEKGRTLMALAREMACSDSVISEIKNRKTYRWVL